jgi:hypothetical protein
MNIVNIYDEQYLLATERVIAPYEGKYSKSDFIYAYGMDCGG